MHYCFVSREYPPNLMGGIGTYVVNMVRILAEAGHTVSMLTQGHESVPQRGMDDPVLECEGRLRVYYLPFVDGQWNLLPEANIGGVAALMQRDLISGFGPIVTAALGKLLLREPVDVIEAPEYEAPLLHFQQTRAGMAPDHPWQKVPTVVHLHSPSHMIFQHNDDPLTGRWVRARKANEALSIQLADGVLCPSSFLAGQVRKWLRLPEERVNVLPYPIGPLLHFDEGAEPVPGRCLFVGRVEPRKGVFEFVEAAVEVAKQFPDATFRFVGGPHFRDGKAEGMETAELLHKLIPAGLRERFDFAGRVPRETLGDEYRKASFCAVPSRWDNYPNTCMEAMSCGRAVVASDQGGMAEMLVDGESGFVCPGGDGRQALVEQLKQGLRRALSAESDELARMGAAAQERILDICNDGRIAKAHESWYASLKESRLAHAQTAQPLASGVILLDDGPQADSVVPAVKAVAAQSVEPVARLLASQHLKRHTLVAEPAAEWSAISDAIEGNDATERPLPERLTEWLKSSAAEVLYVGAADDKLGPDALRVASNYFANHPKIGFCASWTGRDYFLKTAYRLEPAWLLSPAGFPERWFFRKEAVLDAGGLLKNGSYLADLLRDLALRMLERGWQGGCLAGVYVQPAFRESGSVLHPFAFNERRDSARAVVQAHREWTLAASPEAGVEPYTGFAD